ncbi:hypothetical protein D3C76_11910 [compost metagenome]
MKVSSKDVKIGMMFEVIKDEPFLGIPDGFGELDIINNFPKIPIGAQLIITKPPKRKDDINYIFWNYNGSLFRSHWTYFKNATKLI